MRCFSDVQLPGPIRDVSLGGTGLFLMCDPHALAGNISAIANDLVAFVYGRDAKHGELGLGPNITAGCGTLAGLSGTGIAAAAHTTLLCCRPTGASLSAATCSGNTGRRAFLRCPNLQKRGKDHQPVLCMWPPFSSALRRRTQDPRRVSRVVLLRLPWHRRNDQHRSKQTSPEAHALSACHSWLDACCPWQRTIFSFTRTYMIDAGLDLLCVRDSCNSVCWPVSHTSALNSFRREES